MLDTQKQLIAQELADRWALKAQSYAGYFYGHPTRAGQFGKADNGRVFVDKTLKWQAPLARADRCEFCLLLTDQRAEERIAGFQAAMDIEVINRGFGKSHYYSLWLQKKGLTGELLRELSHRNRRAFIEEWQDQPNPHREHGWNATGLDLTKLPLYLKRRLCVEWNHILRDYLVEKPFLYYDFEAREIKMRETDEDLSKRVFAADPEEDASLRADLEADYAFAASIPGPTVPLADSIAQEYAEGLF
jgi:hypothetical protein